MSKSEILAALEELRRSISASIDQLTVELHHTSYGFPLHTSPSPSMSPLPPYLSFNSQPTLPPPPPRSEPPPPSIFQPPLPQAPPNPTRSTSNITTQLREFKISYSTSAFPSKLKHLFIKPPTTTAAPSEADADAPPQNANPIKSKKAQTMSGLINANPWSARIESRLSALTHLSQTTFFQTLRRIKTPFNALRFFDWAQKSGFVHNHHSYFMMLEILGRARHLNPARNFLLSIPKKLGNTVPLTDRFFNSLIRSYGEAGLFQESMKVFQAMKSMGISPSIITFNSLFFILLKRGRVGKIFELYDEMLSTYGVKPDSFTFNVLIRGFVKNSMVDEAFRMFREMDKFKCEPDLVMYNTIVDGLCRAGKVNIAHNVVNGMHNKCENLRPNVVISRCFTNFSQCFALVLEEKSTFVGDISSIMVRRRGVVLTLYALEEVYKEFLSLHLEDKVVLKGRRVDTTLTYVII